MRKPKSNAGRKSSNTGLDPIGYIEARTDSQQVVLNSFKHNHMILDGFPGTGKTFLALALSLQAVERQEYERVLIIRSTVEGRTKGFLPGSSAEKDEPFEAPYVGIVSELYGRADAYEILKTKHIINFRSTSHNRGLTFANQIVIVDECQNLNDQELHTIITRLGEGSKLILCGDKYQDDLTSERYKEVSGMTKIVQILKNLSDMKHVVFSVHDIVRSDFVKDYLIARGEYETRGEEKTKFRHTLLQEVDINDESVQSLSSL